MVLNENKDTKVMKESIDPFKGLKPVSEDPKSMDGYVTDGYGHIFKIPTSGKSAVVNYRGKWYYDYAKRAIVNANDRTFTEPLSASSWFDGPEYWIDKIFDQVPTKMTEAARPYGVAKMSPQFKSVMQKIFTDVSKDPEHFISILGGRLGDAMANYPEIRSEIEDWIDKLNNQVHGMINGYF